MTLSPALQARGLRPVAQLAADRPHGVRLRYMAGCRCAPCRKANSTYERERQKARRAGDWNGVVPADKARAHIKRLSRQGVGYRAIHEASDVARTVLVQVGNGRKTHIRARTERKILLVHKGMALDRALTSATRSLRLIAELVAEGYTKGALARRLGYKTRAVQFNRARITVKNAARIERLHRELTT